MSELQDELDKYDGKVVDGRLSYNPKVFVAAARLVANLDIAIIDRKDIEAATVAWTVIGRNIDPVQSEDFANTLSAASLLNFFFEKILPAALTAQGDE